MLHRQTSETNPGDWFELGEDRLKIADLAWRHEGLTAAGIECLQEAAERYLKGFLIANGWKLKKTHDLETLVGDAILLDAAFQNFTTVAGDLTEDFFAQHYPGGDMTNLGSNYESMRARVGEIIDLIKSRLPQFFPK